MTRRMMHTTKNRAAPFCSGDSYHQSPCYEPQHTHVLRVCSFQAVRVLLFVVLILQLASLPSAIVADEGSVDESYAVEVKIHIIHASNQGDTVDPRLEEIRRQLSAFNFSSFALIETKSSIIKLGSHSKIMVPGERTLTITPKEIDEDNRLRLRLKIDDIIDTTYTIATGATLIVGGPRHLDGHLILAVNQKTVH